MFSNYKKLRENLESGNVWIKEVVDYYLSNIEKGKHLNAFLSVFKEEALERAELIQQKLNSNTAGKLAGMVIAVKDVLSLKNKPLTCASKILENFTALYTATSVQRLIDEDAIIIGKTNCDEFAMGSSNENSAYGAVKNPYDETRVPGGSSGGSAVSVAADMCMTALGTDTGGSVRQPASFCGVIGMKPTYGRVSRYGLTAFASSFDTVGVFANNINDCALVLDVISGKDEMDSTSVDVPAINYNDDINDIKKLKIGYVKENFAEGLDKEIYDVINEKIDKLRQNGFEIKEIHTPHSKYSVQAYYILTTAEASSNLARYDGVRYGVRAKESVTIEEMYINSRTEGFGSEVKRRIMLGTYVLSAGYYDAYYKKAQKVRRLIKNDFRKAFEEVDLIISPAAPSDAFKIGEKVDDPLAMYLNDIYTTTANLTGNPAICIPAGRDSKGLPIGLQITGKDFDEVSVLKLADFMIRYLPGSSQFPG
ncbi:MAG: Asp-tRNA(Asn)/Glu-tRNA(Gln) amidotransferase subunit GatA [Ignavibacteriae bacterium]|nr:MAG: Asp-tRNA(Asn)/Glu-tRNA(Gln) amidotransferase subunit GatA [Ignavibacteriota bacterium]